MLDGESPLFRRLVVVLDDLAPWQGAFAHDWAWRLHAPIHVICPPWIRTGKAGINGEDAEGSLTERTEWLGAGAQASAELGVACEVHEWEDNALTGLRRFLDVGDLCIFSHTLPLAHKRYVFQQTLRYETPALLVCSRSYAPLSRILLLCSGKSPNELFLNKAVQLCRAFGAWPVVLSVANSERAAQQLQQAARETLASYDLRCDFDFLVGPDVGAAAASVARWRGCQLVVMEQQTAPAWLRWLRGDPLERLIGFMEPLNLLALPEVGVPVARSNLVRTAPASVKSIH